MKDEYGTRKTPACQPKTEPFALIRPPLWQIFCALALIYMGATRGVEKDLYYFLKKLNQLFLHSTSDSYHISTWVDSV